MGFVTLYTILFPQKMRVPLSNIKEWHTKPASLTELLSDNKKVLLSVIRSVSDARLEGHLLTVAENERHRHARGDSDVTYTPIVRRFRFCKLRCKHRPKRIIMTGKMIQVLCHCPIFNQTSAQLK